jgi:replicative DNA helicase
MAERTLDRPGERTERRSRGTTGRVPPHNVEAEGSLLGALLLSPDAIISVAEMGLTPEDFYKPAYQHIYDAIRTLVGAGEPADAVTVADELRRAGLLDDIGGPGVLLDLQTATPAISNAARYGRIVRDTALLRRLIGVAGEIAEIAYDEPDDVTKALDAAENKVFQLADHQVVDSTRPLSELLGEAFDDLQLAYERGTAITGVATGYHDLDDLLSGLQPETLNVVGARPSMGKTSFALGMAAHVAINGGLPVLFFSLEMGHKELTGRILSAEARVDSKKLRTGDLTETDWSKIGRAIGRLDAPLYLDDNPNVTVMEIRAKARRMKARHGGLGLVVVDYLQLMSGRLGAENRQVEVSEISRGLKILARELRIPILALSQLSRNLESRGEKRPMLSDLRESGSIEQDADVVMFIYRDEVYNPDSPDRGAAEIIVAKHRNGPIGTRRLVFLGQYTRFDNAARGV